MNTYTIFEYLLELNQESAKELIKIYYKQNNKKTLVVFPKKRDNKIRISEQELRFVMTNLHGEFSHPNLSFSVETPTKEEYSFSKKGKRSASSDLTFYHENSKILNIELKAHNPRQESIDKDIEKLINEPYYGAWVHLFENEDSGTVLSLFEKFKISFKKYTKPEHPISFHVLILKTKTLLSRKGMESDLAYFNVNKIFDLNYSEWKNLSVGKHFIRDWQIDKF